MSRFADKVVVVTGAGRGIGEAVARRFAEEGARLAVISRTEANAARTAEEINSQQPDASRSWAVDIADHKAVLAVGKEVIEHFGKVDVLINNAGVTRDGLCLRMSEEDWSIVLDTNLKGAFNTVKAFQRSLLRQPGASIINISSVIGLIGNAGQVNYAASKAGLIGLTKSLAREYAGRGLRANAVAPGFIATDMTDSLTDEQKAGIMQKIPLARMGSAGDIADACAFLASAEAAYITGQVLVVDGGMVM